MFEKWRHKRKHYDTLDSRLSPLRKKSHVHLNKHELISNLPLLFICGKKALISMKGAVKLIVRLLCHSATSSVSMGPLSGIPV